MAKDAEPLSQGFGDKLKGVTVCSSDNLTMTTYYSQLSIGDWVALTKEGAKETRLLEQSKFLAGGAALGAIALPLALPGAFLSAVGIAGAGTGFALGGAAQVTAGAVGGAGILNAIRDYLTKSPEASAVGIITGKQKRWWGQPGYDYQVAWAIDGTSESTSWHVRKHLVKIESLV